MYGMLRISGLIAALFLCAPGFAQTKPAAANDSLMITIFLRHQQDKNLDSLQKPDRASFEKPANSKRHRVSDRLLLPDVKVAEGSSTNLMQVARLDAEHRGFVIDYSLVTSQDDFTFLANSTYRITGIVNLGGTTLTQHSSYDVFVLKLNP